MNPPGNDPVRKYIVIEAADQRLRIMVSSTTLDLPQHRKEAMDAISRLGHTPVVMEHGSAEWKSDAIKFSLEKVEHSQVYLGIIAQRYGHIPEDPIRNPHRFSITELEYRHAVKLGIPTLNFLADETHEFTAKQIDFDEEKRRKLEKLKAELQREVCGFFDSPITLREEVLVSLQRLQIQLIQSSAVVTVPRSLPRPPEVYAVPDYTLTNQFIGRSSELDRLDAWAKSSDAIMVIEGIGGLGKSAVTWEWMNDRASAALPNLAGRVWWSFYEKGTSMVTFAPHRAVRDRQMIEDVALIGSQSEARHPKEIVTKEGFQQFQYDRIRSKMEKKRIGQFPTIDIYCFIHHPFPDEAAVDFEAVGHMGQFGRRVQVVRRQAGKMIADLVEGFYAVIRFEQLRRVSAHHRMHLVAIRLAIPLQQSPVFQLL